MSVKNRTGIGLTMAVFLLVTYMVATSTKERMDRHSAVIEVSWSPQKGSSGAVIVVRVAGSNRIRGETFIDSPLKRNYEVKRGDQVLVVVDPAGPDVRLVGCAISIDGDEKVRDAKPEHTVCWTEVQ